MVNLEKDWITQGLIDFEFKKYQLLAYLKFVNQKFTQNKLYPQLSDLIFHYNNIISLKQNKKFWFEKFPMVLDGLDLKNLRLSYQRIIEDGEIMKELNEIMEFAIPSLKSAVASGTDIYDYVESTVEITPVGLSPIYKDEGYLFIHQSNKSNMKIYRFTIKIFERATDKYRGIETDFVEEKRYRKFRNLENDKLMLVRKFKELPNPATYLVTTSSTFPFEETLFPIAKRYLVRYISTT